MIKLLAVSDMGVCGRVFRPVELHVASTGLEAFLCVPSGDTIKLIQLLPC